MQTTAASGGDAAASAAAAACGGGVSQNDAYERLLHAIAGTQLFCVRHTTRVVISTLNASGAGRRHRDAAEAVAAVRAEATAVAAATAVVAGEDTDCRMSCK